MMYSMEVAAQTQRDLRHAEAENDRLARAARGDQKPGWPWHTRLSQQVTRRLTGATGAA
jgi:hypothetical protein